MVLRYVSTVVKPPAILYMGRDKHENEELIRWGWPEDVWFHVDKYSSAHVYLRLQPGQTIDDISKELITDCVQLVKYNSIEGNKLSDIDVVYTMWSNLKKTGDMAVGQVGFFSPKAVRKVRVEKRINEIVNRLKKTEVVDDKCDYQAEREERDRKERNKEREASRKRMKAEQEERDRLQHEKELRSYDRVLDSAKMVSNKATAGAANDSDDDFM